MWDQPGFQCKPYLSCSQPRWKTIYTFGSAQNVISPFGFETIGYPKMLQYKTHLWEGGICGGTRQGSSPGADEKLLATCRPWKLMQVRRKQSPGGCVVQKPLLRWVLGGGWLLHVVRLQRLPDLSIQALQEGKSQEGFMQSFRNSI